jgi:Bacteroidetes VLRF1 release factor
MVAGGHFAGAVVRVARGNIVDGEDASAKPKKGKVKRPPPDNEILLHKTFHRYTSAFQFWSSF